MSILAAAALLLVPLRPLTAHVVRYGLLVSVPAWSSLLVWACLPHTDNPLPAVVRLGIPASAAESLSAPPSAAALQVLMSLLVFGLLGGLQVLALAATEVADANVTVARRSSGWRFLSAGPVVSVLVLAKAAFLGLGFAGFFGHHRVGETWDRGYWAPWVLSVVLVVLACTGHLAARARALQGRLLGPVTTLLVVGFGLPGLVFMVLVLFQAAANALLPGLWQVEVRDHIYQAGLFLTRFAPLATVVVAGAVGLTLLARRARSDGAVLAVAAFAVGLPVAVQIALAATPKMIEDRTPITRSLLSLPILDAVVTAALLVAVVVAAVRPRRALPARDLLIILVASSLLSFAVDAFIPESIQARLFVVALIGPVVWRFAVDTRGEQQRPVYRTVLSMAAWSVLVAVSGLALAQGYGPEQWGAENKLQWRLVAIPLAFVLLCQRSQPSAEPRLLYAAGALTAVLVASAVGFALVRVLEVPREERGAHLVSTTLPDNWLPGQCRSEGDAEVVMLVPDDKQAFISAGHGRASDVALTLAKCDIAGKGIQGVLKDPHCTGATTAGTRIIAAAGMSGVEFRSAAGVIVCVHWKADGIERFVTVEDWTPGLQQTRPAVTAAIEKITFTTPHGLDGPLGQRQP
ncbi:hypothetical protein [Streptomyces sp. WAC01280]|uniref:hypothetical protein n=1 Tax=Streptomyces sp. WAC01280 TaxID=2487424 RepID=UPI000F7813D0|nr:hypothetical protein [Streptomyces sp. WAC01280]RSS57391.1 hypothetical protein EF909_15600 [Streptomyces sp. WAC01280]